VGAADWSAISAVILPIAVSILGGGLAMAWRLGGLERTVKDTQADVQHLDRRVEGIEHRLWDSGGQRQPARAPLPKEVKRPLDS
jgi:hypothetical protein